MIVSTDIEANGFDPDTIHCVCTKELQSGETNSFINMSHYEQYVMDNDIKKHVFHNGLGYDVKVINKLIRPNLILPKDVIDTAVVSKLVNYKKFRTHSLKEIGEYLKVYKGDYSGGWDVLTPEMLTYCEQDVEVLEAILKYYWKHITNPSLSLAMETEHGIAWLCQEMNTTGFRFNKMNALSVLGEVEDDMMELEQGFANAFNGKLVEVNRIKYRKKADGSLFKNVQDAIDKYPKTEVEGGDLVLYNEFKFNPASPKERIDVLWDAGWKPYDKTDGHKKSLRKGWLAR